MVVMVMMLQYRLATYIFITPSTSVTKYSPSY
jgi:hypothetical protein